MSDSALILVVEDEAVLRLDLTEELQEAGYRVLAAADGQQALTVLHDTAPDLILCDITMPGLDGFGVLESLRRTRPDLTATPFIFLTALSGNAEVIEGKRLGADDYLVKPVDYDLMLATIAARLRQVDRICNSYEDRITTLRHSLTNMPQGAVTRALDLIALGVVLLDGAGRILYSNDAAHDIVARAGFAINRNGGAGSTFTPPNRALHLAVTEALARAKAGQEHLTGVMMQHEVTGRAASVSVCALPRHEQTSPSQPHAALFLPVPVAQRQLSETLLCQLFDLTPTEARVAAALAGGLRLRDVAVQLNVSQTTIAFHMRNLFQKTSTNRQADLVALILGEATLLR